MLAAEHDRRRYPQLTARRLALPRRRQFDFLEIGDHPFGAGKKPLPGVGHADGTRCAG